MELQSSSASSNVIYGWFFKSSYPTSGNNIKKKNYLGLNKAHTKLAEWQLRLTWHCTWIHTWSFHTRVSHMKALNCMLKAGPPSLHYYCAFVLHSCIVLPRVGHSSNHQYHCCQLTTDNRAVFRIFYRTFKVFVWISLVLWTIWL